MGYMSRAGFTAAYSYFRSFSTAVGSPSAPANPLSLCVFMRYPPIQLSLSSVVWNAILLGFALNRVVLVSCVLCVAHY